jgi:hypothetical protein
MKEKRQRIIVYGDSVVLDGVRASLKRASQLEIISLDQPPASLAENLPDLHPQAVIFDLGSVSPDFPLALLHQSNLVLIGIDPETHQALVWSERHLSELSMQELVEIIQGERHGDAEIRGHGDAGTRRTLKERRAGSEQ